MTPLLRTGAAAALALALAAFVPGPAPSPSVVTLTTGTHVVTIDYAETVGARRQATIRVERRTQGRAPWRGALSDAAILPADGTDWILIQSFGSAAGGTYRGAGRLPAPENIGAIAFRTERGQAHVWTGTAAGAAQRPRLGRDRSPRVRGGRGGRAGRNGRAGNRQSQEEEGGEPAPPEDGDPEPPDDGGTPPDDGEPPEDEGEPPPTEEPAPDPPKDDEPPGGCTMRDPWGDGCWGGDMQDPWGDVETDGETVTIGL